MTQEGPKTLIKSQRTPSKSNKENATAHRWEISSSRLLPRDWESLVFVSKCMSYNSWARWNPHCVLLCMKSPLQSRKSLEVSVCWTIQKDSYQRKASLCFIEVLLRPILGTAALFGDLAVHRPSISCKNFKIELLGLSQTAPMTPQLCLW